MEQEIEGDCAAEHLCQITGADREFAKQPVGPACPFRIPVAAALGQILAGNHAEPSREDLKENRHQAGAGDDPEQIVFELRAALQIGAPVAGIHVADTDQQRRADIRAPLLPEPRLIMTAPPPCRASLPATWNGWVRATMSFQRLVHPYPFYFD